MPNVTAFVVVLLSTFVALVVSQCPVDKPFVLSSELCFKSCSEIPFGHYVSDDFSLNCYSYPTHPYNGTSLSLEERLGGKCPGSVPAMFFSWVVYEHNPAVFTGKNFTSSNGYPRLLNCGEWTIVNEVHLESDLLNSHASFAVNDKAGVLVVAFEGTEISADRWKQSLVDWVFNDFYTSLVPCELSPECAPYKVHAGFQRSVLGIKQVVLEQVKHYIEAGYLVVFSGHSKGAAMSTFATAMANFYFRYIPNVEQKLYNLNFGSPRVADDNFVHYYDKLVPDNKTMRFANRFFHSFLPDCDDLVTTVPPEWLGYRHVKNGKYVTCEQKWFGNPNPIKGISFQLIPQGKYLPAAIGCHFQETYLDGILYGPPTMNSHSVAATTRATTTETTLTSRCKEMCRLFNDNGERDENVIYCESKCLSLSAV